MKQLLFLLLFPCLALAQYQNNAGQKITLGEQSTADGLVYRGVANDTNIITPFSDTSAYIILDTVNSKFYHYNRTTTYWSLAGGGVSVTSFSGGSTGLTPSDATTGAVTLGGTLAVANGGTNATTLTANKVMVGNGTSGVLTPTNLHWDNTNERLGIGIESPTTALELNKTTGNMRVLLRRGDNNVINFGSATEGTGIFGIIQMFHSTQVTPDILLYTNDDSYINNNYNFGIGTTDPTQKLHVVGNARITAVGAGAFGDDLNITSDGTLTTETSDEKYKYNILPISYGLNTILQLKPVNFQWIKGEENDLGFIAQDVAEIIPEAVNTNWNSDLLMRYNSIIPILTKAIQEQQALIKALEQRILILENK